MTVRHLAVIGDSIISEWADWLGDRMTPSSAIPRPVVERELRLILGVLDQTVGPMRREVKDLWSRTFEHFGRLAAARGLASGEVVEEVMFLRILLIRNLAPVLVRMRNRQAMAIIIRLNTVLDQGCATAVVSYTDALVATIFGRNGVPAPDTNLDLGDIERQLEHLEQELAGLNHPL
ncbi:MAG TPA: hypothetical protein VMJ30_10835 [Gemmatimonadales bacterium]|nr:hypothetical protein [Gemmatimonadales bacterium]